MTNYLLVFLITLSIVYFIELDSKITKLYNEWKERK